MTPHRPGVATGSHRRLARALDTVRAVLATGLGVDDSFTD